MGQIQFKIFSAVPTALDIQLTPTQTKFVYRLTLVTLILILLIWEPMNLYKVKLTPAVHIQMNIKASYVAIVYYINLSTKSLMDVFCIQVVQLIVKIVIPCFNRLSLIRRSLVGQYIGKYIYKLVSNGLISEA